MHFQTKQSFLNLHSYLVFTEDRVKIRMKRVRVSIQIIFDKKKLSVIKLLIVEYFLHLYVAEDFYA